MAAAATVVVGAVKVEPVQLGSVNTSVSNVTAPLRASARPCTVTPVSTEIDVRAKMLPTNCEPVPSVAELPTCQKMLHSAAPLISKIELAELVINVESVWKMKTAELLPWPSRTSWPLRLSGALDDPAYTPGARVKPNQVRVGLGELDRTIGRIGVRGDQVVLRLQADGVCYFGGAGRQHHARRESWRVCTG